MNDLENKKDLATILKEAERRKEIIEEVSKLIKEWPELELPEQVNRRNSILAAIPLLVEQDRKSCIRHLATAGVVALREGLEKVKKYAKDLGIDKEDAPLVNYAPNLAIITPAQDFIGNVAFVTVPVKILIDNKMELVNYLITSERQKIRLSDDELLKMSFYSERKPSSTPRWSDKSIESFINSYGVASIAEVFNDIYQLCKRYIDFGNDLWAKYNALWIMGTYFHRIFETYPYVHLNGDMESGKTKTLTFTAWLSFNGELTFTSSSSYVVRVIHHNHSTCCIDEAERLKGSDDQDSQLLIAMYNSGYKKGSYCGKAEQNDRNGQWIPRKFEAYSPKMFASIRGLEASLSSRCVPIIMLKTGNKEIKNRELDSNNKDFQEIRDKLYQVMLTYYFLVSVEYKQIRDEEILGREWELWRPILAIAKTIDRDNDGKFNLYNEMRNHALEVQKLKKEARLEETLTPKVLKVLKEALSAIICPYHPENFWPIADLAQFFKDSGEDEFAWLNDEKKHYKSRWIGDILRKAGIVDGRAKQMRIGDKNVKGFHISLEKIEERLKNYEI